MNSSPVLGNIHRKLHIAKKTAHQLTILEQDDGGRHRTYTFLFHNKEVADKFFSKLKDILSCTKEDEGKENEKWFIVIRPSTPLSLHVLKKRLVQDGCLGDENEVVIRINDFTPRSSRYGSESSGGLHESQHSDITSHPLSDLSDDGAKSSDEQESSKVFKKKTHIDIDSAGTWDRLTENECVERWIDALRQGVTLNEIEKCARKIGRFLLYVTSSAGLMQEAVMYTKARFFATRDLSYLDELKSGISFENLLAKIKDMDECIYLMNNKEKLLKQL